MKKDYEAIAYRCTYPCNRIYCITCHTVHAADSVYTTTDGKAGTIVKIDNGGSEVSSFEESIMNADGRLLLY